MQWKMSFVSFLGIGLAFTAVAVQAESLPEGSYAGVGIAQQNVSFLDSGNALVLRAGKPMDDWMENFSVEGELTYSVSPPSYDYTYRTSLTTTATNTAEYTYTTLAGYGKYDYQLNDKFDIHARAGLIYKSVSVSSDASGYTGGDSEMGLSYGVGGAYAITDKISVTADYTVIDADIDHIGVGANYRF